MTMNITRKDAIKTLHELWRETNDSWYKEVFNMAIDALSESSGDLISRAEAIKAVRKELVCDGRHETHDKVCRFIADVLLTALPSAKGGDAEMNESKPQYYMQVSPSNGADLISRADAIEAIVNTGSKVAYRDASESVLFGSAFRQKEIIDIINALPSAEAPTDLISREAAIEAVAEDLASVLNVSKDETRELAEHALAALPSAEAETDEENELKFYYVESIDDYWVGRRLDNFYYANWHNGLGFVWSHSRYLPWGEHIVDENTLWKEHTYPSEPIEIPFTEWVVGFVKKYFTEPKTAEWIPFTRRPMTEEEQKDYPNCTFIFDCVLPDDGDEILVSNGRFVWMDTFCNDIDGCYLDSGDDIDEDMAWMPLPKPYKGGEK